MSSKVQIALKDFQKRKIKKAMKEGNNVKIRIDRSQLDGENTIILDNGMVHKIDLIRTKGTPRDITITRENLTSMKEGGFLQFLVPAAVGLVTSLIGGSGLDAGCGCTKKNDTLYLGEGLRLRVGSGLYLKSGNNLYDISSTKEGAGFLSAIMKVLPALAKKVLPALGIGALTGVASEGASQVVKKIAGKGGKGLFLQHGGKMYDLTDTEEGSGLLGKLLGLPGGKVPGLGDIPLVGALF